MVKIKAPHKHLNNVVSYPLFTIPNEFVNSYKESIKKYPGTV